MSDPTPPPAEPQPAATAVATRPPSAPLPPNRGSLVKGVMLAWAIVVGGYIVLGMLLAFLSGMVGNSSGFGGPAILLVFALAPWLGVIALAIHYAAHGEPRSAAGLGLGVGTIFAVVLLLVAACFGLLAGTNWH